MDFISVFLFAVSTSTDNFIIGLSYGILKIKINIMSNLNIAFISCIGTFISMLIGKTFVNYIPSIYSNYLGSVLLILLGLYMLIGSLKKKSLASCDKGKKNNYYENFIEHPEIIDSNNSKNIEFKESILLGIILCINNFGLGIGASITGLNIYLTSFCSMIFSIVFIKLGFYIGNKSLPKNLSNCCEIVSSLIIIILGIYELII